MRMWGCPEYRPPAGVPASGGREREDGGGGEAGPRVVPGDSDF